MSPEMKIRLEEVLGAGEAMYLAIRDRDKASLHLAYDRYEKAREEMSKPLGER